MNIQFDLKNFLKVQIESEYLSKSVGAPILIISHPRSGTHLTIDSLRRQFEECKSYKYPFETQSHLYLPIEGFLEKIDRKRLTERKALKIIQRPQRPIIKMHT